MSTRSKGLAFLATTTGGLLFVATTIAGAATNAASSSQAVAFVETLQPGIPLPPGSDLAGPPVESLSVGSIGPNGFSIFPASPANLGSGDPKSHTVGNQLCKIYTSLADFTADHGTFSRLNCALDACLEDFECTPQAAAALTACTSGQDIDCSGSNAICSPNPSVVAGCAGAPTIVKGVAIREQNPRPQIVAGQVGLLDFGPAWFSNPSKFVGNNFFSDSLLIKFTGLPASCSSGNPLPKVVGFNPVNYQNHAQALNYVTVKMAGGLSFVYTTLADNSERYFTGVCCSAGIESVEFAHNGAFGEGVDNLRFGKGGTCATPKIDTTTNQLSDALEALEAKIDKLDLTPVNKKLDVLEIKLDSPASGPKK